MLQVSKAESATNRAGSAFLPRLADPIGENVVRYIVPEAKSVIHVDRSPRSVPRHVADYGGARRKATKEEAG